MTTKEIVSKLKSLKNPQNVAGMARFGINPNNTFGISIPVLRALAKEIKKTSPDTHILALELWETKIHEAKILACLIDQPDRVTEKQMDNWINDFDSWDVCDQVCANLFDRTPFAFKKAVAWTKETKEFKKRAGFALMAALAWHAKDLPDKHFEEFFPLIIKQANDDRNYVKKAVNWALRQIGKRNPVLRQKAITVARTILNKYPNSKAARFIANDAIRELTSKK